MQPFEAHSCMLCFDIVWCLLWLHNKRDADCAPDCVLLMVFNRLVNRMTNECRDSAVKIQSASFVSNSLHNNRTSLLPGCCVVWVLIIFLTTTNICRLLFLQCAEFCFLLCLSFLWVVFLLSEDKNTTSQLYICVCLCFLARRRVKE